MAIVVSSLVTGLFSVYLVVSFVHLKIKASVSNMRYVEMKIINKEANKHV